MSKLGVFDFIKQQLNAPLEPILHASTARLNVVGWFLLVGYPLFGTIWHFLQPQVFDGPLLRLGFAALGLPLISSRINRFPAKKSTERIASIVLWIDLPFAFTWMYVTNGGISSGSPVFAAWCLSTTTSLIGDLLLSGRLQE
jgi:two-component system CAI-1 autoinducer sensor kinase/phosphatase CqsS